MRYSLFSQQKPKAAGLPSKRNIMNFTGNFNIVNAAHNYMIVEPNDTHSKNAIVGCRPQMHKTAIDDPKVIWQIIDNGGAYNIYNMKYGYLFADADHKDGDDYVVEIKKTPTDKQLDSKEFLWEITKDGIYYAISNKKHKRLFSADSKHSGADHVVECNPDPSSDDKKKLKYQWFIFSKDRLELNNWMSYLSEDRYVSDFSIPGTHESCTESLRPPGRCQKLTYSEQLLMGTRFLDVRGVHSKGHIAISHDIDYTGFFFGDVQNNCIAFLKANPSECILMSVKDEIDGTDPVGTYEERFLKYIEPADISPYWYIGTSIPKLKDVRGKIVLLRRFNGTVGLDIKTGWKNNEKSISVNAPPINCSHQDFYKLGVSDSKETKWQAIDAMLTLSISPTRQADRLFLNFTSAGRTTHADGPESIADYINPKLLDYFNQTSGNFGVLPMDFATANLNALIIAANF
jgi:1-phosphatidylinositol phosphodiesterase